jgi:CheY-like chemotaxis protein
MANILYVENHAIFATQVKQQFLAEHSLTLAPSIAEARRALEAHAFDLVLCDYDLDDGKGDEFVRECRASHPEIPIVAVSSHDLGNAALVAAGASAICSKMEFNRIPEVIQPILVKRGKSTP